MCNEIVGVNGDEGTPVSYTHLDVYKRQVLRRNPADAGLRSAPAAVSAGRTELWIVLECCLLYTSYAPLFEKRRLTADIADGVRIRGDETLLRRAVGCLLENAAKYSPCLLYTSRCV